MKKQKTEQPDDLLKKFLANLPFCVDALNADGQIVFWNKTCEKITGYTQKEMIGNPDWMELLYPDAAYRNQLLTRWAKTGNSFRHWEMRLRAKDGTTKVISWTNISDFLSLPQWHTWAIGFDVTHYTDLRNKLELKENQLKTLMRIQRDLHKAHTPEQIANRVLDHLETFTQADGGLILLYDFEHERAEIVAAKFEQALFYHAENYIPLEKLVHLSEVKQGRVIFIDDLSVYNDNVKLASLLIKKHDMKTAVLVPLMDDATPIGSLSLYSKSRLQLDAEEEKFLIHIGHVLTFALHQARIREHLQDKIMNLEHETREQIAELKQNERRLRAQYESIPVPTYTWQKSGDDFILRDYNDMALAMTYGKIGGLLGYKASEIYKSIPELTDLLQECYENEISIETQVQSTSASQEKSPHYFSIKLAYVAPDSVLMHIEDISEIYRARQTIRRLKETNREQEQQIDRLKNDLYLLTTLLPKINQYIAQLDNLQEKAEEAEKAGLMFPFGKVQIRKFKELKRMTDFSQRYLSLFSVPAQKEEVPLAQLIQSLLEEEAGLLKDVRTHVYLEVPYVLADPEMLKEILSLLIKFVVRQKSKEHTPILRIISSAEEDGHVLIRLKDNGKGRPELAQEEETDFLARGIDLLDETMFNIGLAQRMAQLLSGELRVTSAAEEGTTFDILLPANKEFQKGSEQEE